MIDMDVTLKQKVNLEESAQYAAYHTLGTVVVTAVPEGVVSVDWYEPNEECPHEIPVLGDDQQGPQSQVERMAYQGVCQITEYFDGKRRSFDLPLILHGTVFQQAVWQALTDIPYGETRSYGEVATAISRPKAVRAVGQANRGNHIPIIIPCHRVIGANGDLTGYAGSKTHMKAILLKLERNGQL